MKRHTLSLSLSLSFCHIKANPLIPYYQTTTPKSPTPSPLHVSVLTPTLYLEALGAKGCSVHGANSLLGRADIVVAHKAFKSNNRKKEGTKRMFLEER
jgi:hypothetical protein